jgi:hypothetical protein
MDGWVERALAEVAPNVSQTYARALLCSGMSKLCVQDPASELRLTQAASLALQLGDRWAQGCATAFLGMWNANQGRLDQARVHAAVAVEIADAEADDWLRSLAGLVRSWIALRSGEHHGALAMLQPLRHVGYDVQQHEMIDIYLGLSHYGLGHWREAAGSSLDVFELSVPWRHLRSSAGAIELAAFLAMRTVRPEICARLLGRPPISASECGPRSSASGLHTTGGGELCRAPPSAMDNSRPCIEPADRHETSNLMVDACALVRAVAEGVELAGDLWRPVDVPQNKPSWA